MQLRIWTCPIWTALLLLHALGCAEQAVQSSEPEPPVSIYDLNADAASLLCQLPNVVHVQRHGPTGQPSHRIIHITDWHFVQKDAFAVDMRSLSSEHISDEEIDRRHAELLDEVETIQKQQMELLSTLVRQHGLKGIHVEGLAEKDEFVFDAKVSALRSVGQELERLQKEKEQLLAIGDPDDVTQRIINGIEEAVAQHRRDLVQLGAAGRMLLNREIEGVLPLEDADAHAASNPVADDGSITLDQEKIEAREDAQSRILLDSGPVAVVVLGGAHDLSDNLERLSKGNAECIRVEIEAWKRITDEGK